jgi:hypothetical protein
MIIVSIDVTKISKPDMIKGKKGGVYLDLALLENKTGTDQYGNDGMVVQNLPKSARDAGRRGAILGNYRVIAPIGTANPVTPAATTSADDDPDDIPF